MKKIVIVVAGALLALPPAANANRVNVGYTHVMGHKVGYCVWNPKKARVLPYVRWSMHQKHTVKGWVHRSKRSICAINGNTYNWFSQVPTGPVRARGRWVSRRNKRVPLFGFVGRRIVFGWAAVHKHHPANVMSGKAYLVLHGKPITRRMQAPWTTRSQFYCGARGTDGWYGCFRSAAVRFRSGRVGFVSIALASMTTAGAILKRMGVVTAVTGDSGGGEEYWARGHTFQTIPNAGRYARWRRLIPDAIILRQHRR